MGAIDAFTRTFSIVIENKRLYLLALIMSLVLAPIGAYLIPSDLSGSVTQGHNVSSTRNGSVIIEEYGTSLGGEEMKDFVELLEGLAVYFVIALILGAVFEYGVTKGILLGLGGEGYSLGDLLVEGVKHSPAVILINLVYGLVMLAFVGIAAIPMVIGAFLMPTGAVLIFLGLPLMLVVVFFTTGLSSLAVPLYVDRGKVGAAFEAFGLAFNNFLSTAGFGFLLGIGVMAIAIVVGPVAFVAQTVFPGNVALYASALLQAPFDALMYLFIWAGGVAFYRELGRMEELKKADEELKELGIEL